MSQVYAPNVAVPSEKLTPIEGTDDIAEALDIATTDAEKIQHIIDSRHDDGEPDAIVALDEWAYAGWSDYDVADNRIVLVSNMRNYSESAYLASGAVEVDADEVFGKSLDEVEGEYLNNLVSTVDETDTDFHDELGECYYPKSAVEAILVFDE